MLAAAVCVPLWCRAELADAIMAVVNDKAITFGEVQEYSQDAANALRQQYASQPEVFQQRLNGLLHDALDQLVERQLILHSFTASGQYRPLPESTVDEIVQDRIREQFGGDRVTLIKTLQANGETYEQWRQQVRDRWLIDQLRQLHLQKEVVVSPAKILDYYENHQSDYKQEDQVKLRMIVLNKASANDTNATGLAREIAAKLKEGATFVEMASIYSQGSQQHQGGDWGWVERSVLRKELSDVAFSLAPGHVSDPIESPDAVYIMLVEDKKPAQARPLTEVRKDIEKSLRLQQLAHQQKQWIDGLKKKTFIRYIEL